MVRYVPLLLCMLLVVPNPVAAQSAAKQSAAFFASDQIPHLEIELEKKELEALRRAPRTYAKATLKVGESVYPNIGLHVKGAAGSFRGIDDKPCLTFNMDKFGGEKLFHGMDKWHVSNSVQDPTYLHELICGELFRAAGVPASRVGHAIISINGRKRGLFYIKEGYDSQFLKAHFKTSDGNFYDGGFLREIDQPLQLLRGKNDVKDRADLKALVAAANEPNKDLRFQKLEKVLDMDRFISYLVLEVIVWDWDGYPMNRNNYRIYHDPKRDKIVFIPSGMDQMFGNPGGPILMGFQGLVARAVMNTPEGQKRYMARMKEIHEQVFVPEKLIKRIDELQPRVQAALMSVDKNAGRDYPNQLARMRSLIRERSKAIERQLNKK